MHLQVWALRNDRDDERMRTEVDALVFRPRLSRADRERLDVMLAMMEAYEAHHERWAQGDGGPLRVLRGLPENHGLSASDLGRLLGNRALGSAIVNGKRELSKTHIRTLAAHFAINPGALI